MGGVAIKIAAGTSTAPVTTSFALALADRPAAAGITRGRIAAINGSILTMTNAGWTASALAQADYPYDLHILSGSGEGARLAITANTTDTVTITGRDPAGLGVVGGTSGDLFELVPVDTLDSLFGPDTFLGGDSAASADIVTLGSTSRDAYYFNTTLGHWTDVAGSNANLDATRLSPDGMVAVTRKGAEMVLRITGGVPVSRTNILIADQGSTYLHTGFPTTVTLGNLGLQSLLSGWRSNAAVAQADLLGVASGPGWVFYFHNGTNWQRASGSTSARDTLAIPAGTPIRIVRRGSTAGFTALLRARPFSL